MDSHGSRPQASFSENPTGKPTSRFASRGPRAIAIVLSIFLAEITSKALGAEPTVSIVRLEKRPNLDARLVPGEWSPASAIRLGDGFSDSLAWLGWRDGRLFVALRVTRHISQKPLARVRMADHRLDLDEGLEIRIGPAGTDGGEVDRILINTLGIAWRGLEGSEAMARSGGLNEAIENSVRVHDGGWVLEASLALPDRVTGRFRLRLIHRRWRPLELQSWPLEPSSLPLGNSPAPGALVRLDPGPYPDRLTATPAKLSACRPLWADTIDAASFRIAYEPSQKRLRVHVVPPNRADLEPLDALRLELRSSTDRRVLRRTDTTPVDLLENPEIVMPTDTIQPGKYEVALSGSVRDGCAPTKERIRYFAHDVFGWEGNRLGITDDVIPPFTPIEVENNIVKTVLREHIIDDIGLWQQVRSLGEGLLAAPMRWEVRIDGKATQPAAVAPLSIRREAPGRAVYESRWQAGALQATMRGEFEMDGFMLARLALHAPTEIQIDRLDLIIPLHEKHATLMNAITDGTLHHTLGRVPEGSGRVWDATMTRRRELASGFAPYVWLGTETRGLSWLAESTRNSWSAPGRPVQEIRRTNGRTELIIHFATKPGPLNSDRVLEFALQATPVKPRPSDPRPWRNWQLSCTADDRYFQLCPLASGYYWGAESPFGHVHPRRRDKSVLEAIARTRRGLPIGAHFVDQWMDRNDVPAEEREIARKHVNYTLDAAKRRPDAIIAYINPHDAGWTPEFEVYVDEWRRAPFSDRLNRDVSHLIEIDTTPSASYRDFVIWHLDQLLESEAIDGFFFDNTFQSAVFDTEQSRAWRSPDGAVEPAVDWLGMRELLKRAQILVYQKRGAWLNVGHMTSTPIAAVQAWTGLSLGGEWKYGSDDYQDRFPRDLLRATSIGSQAGTIPVFLNGIKGQIDPKRRRQLERSLAGVTALHEIRVMTRFEGAVAQVWNTLTEAGYGRPECRIHPYWANESGVSIRGVDAEVLVVSCDRRMLALVVSFDERGAAVLELDQAAWPREQGIRCKDVGALTHGLIRQRARRCEFILDRHDFRLIEISPATGSGSR